MIAREKMGLSTVPFSLSDLEYPQMHIFSDINAFIIQCYKASYGDTSDAQAKSLIAFLKENPPKVNYKNPNIPEVRFTQDEMNLSEHIFSFGIDLPGSRFNPFGHLQYYSSFFIDMFFGNFTDFNETVQNQSADALQKLLKKREGHCQFSAIFAPIVGIRMKDVHLDPYITLQEKDKIKTCYSGNEHKHIEVLKDLISYGADVNAHDINGYTPLHHAILFSDVKMVRLLLKNGANPNSESRDNWKPLSAVAQSHTEARMCIIGDLVQYKATLNSKRETNNLRTSVEEHGSRDLAVKVREAMPRDKDECEKCVKPAEKKCAACGQVFYCSRNCQGLDWKFHKISCQKFREEN